MIPGPVYLFDENTSATSGGAPAPAAIAGSPPESTGGGSAPTQPAGQPAGAASDPFEGLDTDWDSVQVESGEPTTADEAGVGEPPPQAEPVAPEPATAAPPAAPQATPQQIPPAAPRQDAQQPQRSTLERAIEGFRTNQNELAQWASTNLFSLSKAEAEALETDAVGAIPLLMGKVYSQALQATTNLIKNFVPEMINTTVNQTQMKQAKAAEALNEFYLANPHLSADKHGAAVDKWARAFRAANPQASREAAIKFVGNAVSAELGIAPGQRPGNGAQQPPARSAPFAPARPGTRVQTAPQDHDPYEGLNMEFDEQ